MAPSCFLCRLCLVLWASSCLRFASSEAKKDYYETLGVSKDATQAELKKAHKKAALRWHPDKNSGDKKEQAQKEFISVQQAYEVLGDPEKRKRYDNQKTFFSSDSEQWDGADKSDGFVPPGDPVQTVEVLRAFLNSGEASVLHVYADQRHFFGGYMTDLAQDVKMGHVHVFTSDERVLQTLGIKRFPTFVILDGSGGVSSYTPSGWDFLNLADAVRQAVTEVLPYRDRIPMLRSELELDNFLKLHPAGSGKPRVVVFADDARRKLLTPFNVCAKLKDTHHCAQLGAISTWVQNRFKLRQVPSFMVIDPATRQGSTRDPQIMYERADTIIDAIKDANFLAEWSKEAFQQKCKGEWDGQCAWIVLFLVPSAALGSDEPTRKALRRYREACKPLQEAVACFWLRHDSDEAEPWMRELRPLLEKEEVPDAESANNVWVVGVNAVSRQATAFTKTVVNRERAQRDLLQWIQLLLRGGLDLSDDKDWPFHAMDQLPSPPKAQEEVYGPKAFVERQWDNLQKFYTGLIKYVADFAGGGGNAQLLFFFLIIGWPLLSQHLNGLTKKAAEGNATQQGGLPVGSDVVVDGLRQATEYNGQRGKILAQMAAAPGQPTKYRVQLRTSSDDKVTINMSSAAHGMTFRDGGGVTVAPAGSQAAILGVKVDWIIASIAGRKCEGESKDSITAAFEDARNSQGSFPVIFVTPKVLAIRADNLCLASQSATSSDMD